MTPGSIVRCRNREWVLLPSDDERVHLLRPLTGVTDDVVAVHRDLANRIGSSIPAERVQSAVFPLPTADELKDTVGAHLLWQAARMTLREGATPFRSMGRISIRPRVYQFVPLLMALRLHPVRLLVADDVGVGKTIEALCIARELLDRRDIRRLCVLCPPYLCDQWRKEMTEKFGLEPVVIRSGTVSQLERRKIGQESIYRHYPIQIVSIDFVKSERNRSLFLLDCPEFVIVDEAHGSAVASDRNSAQHQRHELVHELSKNPDRHLVLLTATPHSGISSAFKSLLSLIRPEFGRWDTPSLVEEQRVELAHHFVQRTRKDIENDWEDESCFPVRDPKDVTYELTLPYQDLFLETYGFCSEMIQSGQGMDQRRQRVRYWGALALLRSVMSSPAAALEALSARRGRLASDEDVDLRDFVFESADRTNDDNPVPPIELAENTLQDSEARRIRNLEKLARSLTDGAQDNKLRRCIELVGEVLREGRHPIVWCRYVATAHYVADHLRDSLRKDHPNMRVIPITGRIDEEERRTMVEEISAEPMRVLVATDCLSEGINLQDAFDAVVHYDLPWNPNRLEQREGRVDRYGQKAKTVKVVRLFSPRNPVDGVVIEVLLNKARAIYRALGTHVPVPEEGESVTEAVLNALFLRPDRPEPRDVQLEFQFEMPGVQEFHERWDADARREQVSRTRFAQRALKPQEVRAELEATDSVLGDPDAVREFVLGAAQRLGINVVPDKRANVFRVAVGEDAISLLPAVLKAALPEPRNAPWLVSFVSPTPERAEYLGRNHRFVAAVARYLLEDAFENGGDAVASRCGAIRTRSVSRLTTLLLLRVRYLLEQPGRSPLLSEEVIPFGYTRSPRGAPDWIGDDEALRLLAEAQSEADIPMGERRELVSGVLAEWPILESVLTARIEARAEVLLESHRRVRRAASEKVRGLAVKPQSPPDLLGLLVMQPVVQP